MPNTKVPKTKLMRKIGPRRKPHSKPLLPLPQTKSRRRKLPQLTRHRLRRQRGRTRKQPTKPRTTLILPATWQTRRGPILAACRLAMHSIPRVDRAEQC